jgi:predicted deacetylase
VDFDDLCDQWDPYDLLQTLKANDPDFKATLFAIPKKCSKELLRRYAVCDWLQLAPHGWWHTTGETLSWTSQEAQEKMKAAEAMGMKAGGFKAPKWIISEACREAARELGWFIADHKSNRFLPKQSGDRIYITDLRLRNVKEARLHGHTRNVSGNGIEEMFNMFMLPKGTYEYKFISEVC